MGIEPPPPLDEGAKVIRAMIKEPYTTSIVKPVLGTLNHALDHPFMLLSPLDIHEAKSRAKGTEVLVAGIVVPPPGRLSWAAWALVGCLGLVPVEPADGHLLPPQRRCGVLLRQA